MNTLLATLCSHLNLKPEHTKLLHERDTSDVWRQFVTWLLVGPEYGVIRFTKPDSIQYNAIVQVAQLYIEDCKDADAWEAAFDAAWDALPSSSADAAWSAAKAAYYAASAAANAAAAKAAASASAAYAAAKAAWDALPSSSADAAWSAANAAAAKAAYYAASKAVAAADADYERMADKLIELINAAPLKETI